MGDSPFFNPLEDAYEPFSQEAPADWAKKEEKDETHHHDVVRDVKRASILDPKASTELFREEKVRWPPKCHHCRTRIRKGTECYVEDGWCYCPAHAPTGAEGAEVPRRDPHAIDPFAERRVDENARRQEEMRARRLASRYAQQFVQEIANNPEEQEIDPWA
jgi:hypothetical protein